MGVPQDLRDALPPARRANSGQSPALEAEFLALNRSGRSKAWLKARKDAMLRDAAQNTDPHQ